MFFIELGFKDGVYINTKMNLVIYVMAEIFVLGVIVVVGGFIARKISNEYMYSEILTVFVAGGLRVIESLQTAFENMKYCECIRKIEEKYLDKRKQE